MSWLVIIAGLVGLAAVLAGFAELTHAAFHDRDVRYVLGAVALVGVMIAILILFGDRLLQ